jgi:hypothetical protein
VLIEKEEARFPCHFMCTRRLARDREPAVARLSEREEDDRARQSARAERDRLDREERERDRCV